jgi:hypothetical protein
MWGALSDERAGLSFTIAASPRQRSQSWVRVPWDSWTHFTVLDSRHPKPGGPGPRIYIPQEQGGPVLPFSSPPTTRRTTVEVFDPAYTSSLYDLVTEHTQNAASENSSVICLFVAAETCLFGCCLAKGNFLRLHVRTLSFMNF